MSGIQLDRRRQRLRRRACACLAGCHRLSPRCSPRTGLIVPGVGADLLAMFGLAFCEIATPGLCQ
jgi:hypothetical protein